ncbi:MAG: response regulator, partial [Candidatus Omnitrophota bacterium]
MHLAPRSVFTPLSDHQIEDVTIIRYILNSAERDGKMDLMKIRDDRTTRSLGVDLGEFGKDAKIDAKFRFNDDMSKSDSFRLIPITFRSDGQDEKEYWAFISKDSAGEIKIEILTKSENDDLNGSKLDPGLLKHAEREERLAITRGLESEIAQKEKRDIRSFLPDIQANIWGSVRHDLNNIMVPLISYPEMLLLDFGGIEIEDDSVGKIVTSYREILDRSSAIVSYIRISDMFGGLESEASRIKSLIENSEYASAKVVLNDLLTDIENFQNLYNKEERDEFSRTIDSIEKRIEFADKSITYDGISDFYDNELMASALNELTEEAKKLQKLRYILLKKIFKGINRNSAIISDSIDALLNIAEQDSSPFKDGRLKEKDIDKIKTIEKYLDRLISTTRVSESMLTVNESFDGSAVDMDPVNVMEEIIAFLKESTRFFGKSGIQVKSINEDPEFRNKKVIIHADIPAFRYVMYGILTLGMENIKKDKPAVNIEMKKPAEEDMSVWIEYGIERDEEGSKAVISFTNNYLGFEEDQLRVTESGSLREKAAILQWKGAESKYLAISDEILSYAGGKLEIRNSGNGSVIKVILPYKTVESGAEDKPKIGQDREQPEDNVFKTEPFEIIPGRPNIIFAEDEGSMQQLFLEKAERSDQKYNVWRARNAREAIEVIQKAENEGIIFDIVVSDINMKDGRDKDGKVINGVTLIKQLREAGKEFPIIIFSTEDTDEVNDLLRDGLVSAKVGGREENKDVGKLFKTIEKTLKQRQSADPAGGINDEKKRRAEEERIEAEALRMKKEVIELIAQGRPNTAVEKFFTDNVFISDKGTMATSMLSNELIKMVAEDKRNTDISREFLKRISRGVEVFDGDKEKIWAIQNIAGQTAGIISAIKEGIDNAGMIRVTDDPDKMVRAGDKDRGSSFIDKGSIPENIGIAAEEGMPHFYDRGQEALTKLGDVNMFDKLVYNRDVFEDAKANMSKFTMYRMIHGLVEVVKDITEFTSGKVISTFHKTTFLRDFIPGSYQTASTGPGHFQGLQLDIKQAPIGGGVQFSSVYNSQGEIVEVIAQHVKEGDFCFALPGTVDFVANLGGMEFNDFSIELTPEIAVLFNPHIDFMSKETLKRVGDNISKIAPYIAAVIDGKPYIVKNMEDPPKLRWITAPDSKVLASGKEGFDLHNIYKSIKNRYDLDRFSGFDYFLNGTAFPTSVGEGEKEISLIDLENADNADLPEHFSFDAGTVYKAYQTSVDAEEGIPFLTDDMLSEAKKDPPVFPSLRKAEHASEYIEKNEKFLIDVLSSEVEQDAVQAKLIRIPLDFLAAQNAENVKQLINDIQSTANGYVELYSTENINKVGKDVYAKYGVNRKELPSNFNRTRGNTITLLPVFKRDAIQTRDIGIDKIGGVVLDETIILPTGINYDTSGIIRNVIFGLRITEIVRGQRGSEFIEETLREYRTLCES